MKATIPIAVMPGTKLVRVEWCPHDGGYWRLWTHHNTQLTEGTHFRLHHNGAMERVVLHADGHEDYFTVKGPDTP